MCPQLNLAAKFDVTMRSAGVEVDFHPDAVIDPTLTLDVPSAGDLASRATLTGTVFRDDPFTRPSSRRSPGAKVTISARRLV